LRRRATLLLLLALLAGPGMARAEEKKPEDPRLRKALERSLLFPGLGQLYEKQYLKAALFAAAEVACLALVAVNVGRGNDAYWGYRGAASEADAVARRRDTERYDRRRNTAILAAAGVWVLNMADIFVHAKGKYGRGKAVAFYPFYHQESHAYGAGVACRF
jgi:hypothetical protein